MKFYCLADPLNYTERKALDLPFRIFDPTVAREVRAVATGSRRPPRKGEWYLSGAIVEAYRAPNDLSTAYYIARIVRVETKIVVTTTIIKEFGPVV